MQGQVQEEVAATCSRFKGNLSERPYPPFVYYKIREKGCRERGKERVAEAYPLL